MKTVRLLSILLLISVAANAQRYIADSIYLKPVSPVAGKWLSTKTKFGIQTADTADRTKVLTRKAADSLYSVSLVTAGSASVGSVKYNGQTAVKGQFGTQGGLQLYAPTLKDSVLYFNGVIGGKALMTELGSGYKRVIIDNTSRSKSLFETYYKSGSYSIGIGRLTTDTTGIKKDCVNAIGIGAVIDNSGDNVNALGLSAARSNTGSYVNALGSLAAYQNTGSYVNAIGYYAAKSNIGSNVNALGYYAAQSNSGGNVNALGHSAAQSNTGSDVNALGSLAAYQNTGSDINAFGDHAADSNIGDAVNAIGDSAASQNTGSYVNAIGGSAARGNSGHHVIAIGNNAGYNNTRDTVMLLGFNSYATANRQIVLGSTSYNEVYSPIKIKVTGSVDITTNQQTVNGSVSGSAVFSMPFMGTNYKKVIIYCNALNGTASWTFPVSFTYKPAALQTSELLVKLVTSLTNTSVTVTGSNSTGFIIIEGY